MEKNKDGTYTHPDTGEVLTEEICRHCRKLQYIGSSYIPYNTDFSSHRCRLE